MRRTQLALVRRPPHLLRAIPRHRLPRSLLPAELRRGLRARRVLQLHSQEGAHGGAGPRFGYEYAQVAAGAGQGSEEHEQKPHAAGEEVLGGFFGVEREKTCDARRARFRAAKRGMIQSQATNDTDELESGDAAVDHVEAVDVDEEAQGIDVLALKEFDTSIAHCAYGGLVH